MSNNVTRFAKGGIATAAVGAMALAGATPAVAKHRDHDKIDAGDVIAGALIIGGIAVIASAASKDRDHYGYRDRNYRSNRYGHGDSRAAVEQCVSAVQRDARRAGYRFADVTEIRDVDRERRGWEVKGRLVVDGQRGYGYRSDRRNNYDRRYSRGADRGKFKCEINHGRVTYIDYKGIRGLG